MNIKKMIATYLPTNLTTHLAVRNKDERYFPGTSGGMLVAKTSV